MQRAMWTKDGLELDTVEELGPLAEGYARVRVHACGICGSDLHFWHGDYPRPLGTAPGHEFVGTLIDGPAGLDDVLYAVSPNLFCGRCDYCVLGQTNLCGNSFPGLGLGRDGGLSEQLDVPVRNLAPTTTDDAIVGSLTEPLAVSLRGVGLGNPRPDSRVLILGAGTIGLTAGLLVRDRVASAAITARYPHQRAAAEAIGLTVLDENNAMTWAKQQHPDVVIESVGGAADTLRDAIKAVRRGGTVVMLGAFTEPKTVDLGRMMSKEIALRGSFCYGSSERGPEFSAAAAMTGRYEDELRLLASHQFPLAQAADAFETASDKRSGAIKVTITL